MKTNTPLTHLAVLCILYLGSIALVCDAADPSMIDVELKKPGRVSMAVYDKNGSMLRTLRNADPMEKGHQRIFWDGLTSTGEPAPAGAYEWRLINGPGPKAEYVMSLGISFHEKSWVGQHAGPEAVSVDDGTVVVIAGYSEGSPLMGAFTLDGRYLDNVSGVACFDVSADDGQNWILTFNENQQTDRHPARLINYPLSEGKFGKPSIWTNVFPHTIIFDLQGSNTAPAEDAEAVTVPVAAHSTTAQQWTDLESKPLAADAEWKLQALGQSNPAFPLRSDAVGLVSRPWPEDEKSKKQAATASGRLLHAKVEPGQYIVEVHWGDGVNRYPARHVLQVNNRFMNGPAGVGPEGAVTTGNFNTADGNVEFKFYAYPGSGELGWAVSSIRLHHVANRVTVGNGKLALASTGHGAVSWRNTEAPDTEIGSLRVPGLQDIELDSHGRLYVLTDTSVVRFELNKPAEVVTRGLEGAKRIAVDEINDRLLVLLGAPHRRVAVLNMDGSIQGHFGRDTGRRNGPYVPTDFMGVSDIAVDGTGGFVVTENYAAPRRTARFDADGRLIQEWYGGQQFYTFACPEPDNPKRFWMDSQWSWIMQVEVDYARKAWKVLATYPFLANRIPSLWMTSKHAQRHQVIKADWNGDGRKETYIQLPLQPFYLMRVDDEKGELLPFATVGMMLYKQRNGAPIPSEELPEGFLNAIRRTGEDVNDPQVREKYRYITWTDLNFDGTMNGDEVRVAEYKGRSDPKPEPLTKSILDDDFVLWCGKGWGGETIPPYWRLPPLPGTGKQTPPEYDWKLLEEAPFRNKHVVVPDILVEGKTIYLLAKDGGDGFRGGVYTPGHGFGWPATLIDSASLTKWDAAAGKRIWRVAAHAADKEHDKARIHNPQYFAGKVGDIIGISDFAVQVCSFWTTDGLYLGELLDRRMDDGYPDAVYSWWRSFGADGAEKEQRALIQYDTNLGGVFYSGPDKALYCTGAGLNSVPLYRVHELTDYTRQSGTFEINKPVSSAPREGTGLRIGLGTENDDAKWLNRSSDGPIWFDTGQYKKDHPWPWDTVPENAVIRVSGYIEPKFSEAYRIGLYTKGPATLKLNGREVVSVERPAREFSDPIKLESGQRYPIEIVYRPGENLGMLSLVWESRSTEVQHVPASALYPHTSSKQQDP